MQRQQIILLDSDEDLRQALAGLLSRFQFQLLYAPALQPGLQLLRKNPDVALAIINRALPGTDGLDAAHALRAWKQELPVILLAPPVEDARYDALILSGPTAAVPQPVNLGQLLLTVSRLMVVSAEEEATEESVPVSLDAKVFFTILDISDSGCCLRSHFPLRRNQIVVLESAELVKRLGLSRAYCFPVRVCSCAPNEGTRIYSIGAQFVGLNEHLRGRLHAACRSLKGFKFTGSSK